MVSTRKVEATREAFLDAAWKRLARGDTELRLADVASDAKLSRQALYLHFGSRAGLLVALVAHVDKQQGLGELLATIRGETEPTAQLDRLLEVTARYAARIHELAMIFEQNRARDPALAAAWEDRMASRRHGIQDVLGRVAAAGRLAAPWNVGSATDAIWALSTPQSYQQLVVERGWTVDQYDAFLRNVVRRTFLTAVPSADPMT